LYAFFSGIDEQQIVDGGGELADFALLLVNHHLVFHGDETFHLVFFQIVASLQFSTEGGAHGEPTWIFRGCHQGVFLGDAHSFGSPKLSYYH
jgi:hypothetical protein